MLALIKTSAACLLITLYIVTALIQMLIPETLVVVVCTTLILLGLILSNENMEKYLDEKSMLFNQYSFEAVLDGVDFEKQKLFAGVLCFRRTENNLDWEQDVLVLNGIYKELRQYRLYGYRVGENGVVFISSLQEKVESVLSGLRNSMEESFDKESVTIETKILSGESTADRYSCMQSIISFCTEVGSRIAYIDYLTNIYNRNALERDLNLAQEQGIVYYLIADINNLKPVNDTLGHSAGDKLLQDFARLLVETVGDNGKAYRQGGDEFAVLYEKDAQTLVQAMEKRCQIHNQFSIVPVSYAIGYCRLEDEGFRDVADQMMYEDKKRKKQGAPVR